MSEEREVKFYLDDLRGMQKRLLAAGATIEKPRVFESNARFDTPDGRLAANKQVLRLRQDTRARLTYKGAALENDHISVRPEFEVTVSDYEEAHRILAALGYEVSVMYEKYRTTYHLRQLEIVLDEMPFGNFMEIEGPDEEAIRDAASRLDLDWSARCTENYMVLFDRLRARGLQAEHLTFALLEGKTFTADDFGLKPADR